MRVKRLGAWWTLSVLTMAGPVAAAGSGSLVEAVRQGDRAAVRALLHEHADANTAELDGTTPLHWAALHDDVETVDWLIAAGADAKASNRYGITPLMVACTNGSAAIVGKLLKAGADPQTASPEGETVLMTAARTGNVDTVKVLLAHGAHVNAREQWRGQTALMWAAAENHAPTVRALIDAGAELETRSNGGFTALLFAVRAGGIDAVKVLLDAGANVNDAIQPPARRAAPPPTITTATATSAATATATAESPAAAPQYSPSSQSGAAALGAGRNAGGDPSVQKLLQVFNTGSRGSRASGPGGTSALVLAITNAHFELGAFLLDRGANPNSDGQGWTALHQVAWTRRPPIQHGLPPAVQTGNLDSLALAKKLLEHGADPNARMTKEPTDGARNVLDRSGSTPFLQAAKLGDTPFMRLLLEHGADPSIKTDEGVTPLMAAAGVGIWQVGESAGSNEEAFEAVKLCYELGNEVNSVDANGDSALHGAAHRGANDVVKFLVEKGAKLDVPNKIGWTPFIIADGVFYPNTYNRRLETAQLLRKLGADPKAGKRRPEDLAPGDEQQQKTALSNRQP